MNGRDVVAERRARFGLRGPGLRASRRPRRGGDLDRGLRPRRSLGISELLRPTHHVDHGRDRLLELVAVGHDPHGVVGGPERRRRAVAVDVVARAQVGEDRRGRIGVARDAALLRAAAGALLGRRLEEDLHVGIGQDDGADVAAGEHDRALDGQCALALEERGADLGLTGDLGHVALHRGLSDVLGDVGLVHQHRFHPAVVARGQRDPPSQGCHGRAVVERRGLAERQPRQGAIQEPGVDEPEAELPRPTRAPTVLLPLEAGPSRATTGPRRASVIGGEDRGRGGRRPRQRRTGRAPGPRVRSARGSRPLGRSSSRTEPIRTRTSRTTGMPTAASIRRICRFHPWPMVIRYQWSRGGRGVDELDQASRLDVGLRPELQDARDAFLELDAGAKGRGDVAAQLVADAHRVLALDAVAGMEHRLRPGAVVGQQEQALGVAVEPADRVDARRFAGPAGAGRRRSGRRADR